MSHYAGEIRMVSFKFAPTGWLLCNGLSLPNYAYPELFQAIGTKYGGDDRNFNIPDMRGRAPMHAGRSEGAHAEYVVNTYAGTPFMALHDIKTIPAESATDNNPPEMGYTNIQPVLAVSFIIAHSTSNYED